MVSQQACKLIMALHYKRCMMGILLDGPTWMFGDNPSVIISSTSLNSTLNILHNTMYYHCVRECIVAEALE
jgi:hypothetical protein